MKAQLSFLMKGIFLILILIITSIFLNQLISITLTNAQISSELEMYEKAITISQLLTTSSSCLAYEEKNSFQFEFSKVTQKVLDINKIQDFSIKYEEIEPPCAKSYAYGYEVSIESFPSEVSTGVYTFKQEGKTWRFGSKNFSEGEALKKSLEIYFPISIRINSSFLQPGVLRLKVVKGELEEFAGLVNRVCDTNVSLEQKIFTSYVLFSNRDNICQQLPFKTVCRKVYCEVDMRRFQPGSYNVLIRKIGGKVLVS
ncbi:MAG: hypothetical protein ACP5O8_03850 [Candidatus Aenigmatarchaeota archaeon]